MNASHLLETLRGRGVRLERDGDRLKLDAPKGTLSDLLPDLQRFKPALLELLEREAVPLEPAESPVAFLRQVRNAGASVRIGEVDGKRALVWQFPTDWEAARIEEVTRRLERDGEAIAARLEWETWHWRTLAPWFGFDGRRLDGAPPGVDYTTWRAFARVHCGQPDAAGDAHP